MNREITALAATAMVGVAVALAGCGSPVRPVTAQPSASTNSGGAAAASLPLEYARGMRDHGVPAFPIRWTDTSRSPRTAASTPTRPRSRPPPQPARSTARQPLDRLDRLGRQGSRLDSAKGGTTAQWQAFGASLEAQAKAGQFSGAVLVDHDGDVVLDAGYGLANRAAEVPNTHRRDSASRQSASCSPPSRSASWPIAAGLSLTRRSATT